jgi:hypothetical protein
VRLKLSVIILILVGAALISLNKPVSASDCSDEVQNYNNALEEVSSTLRRYSRCVADSRGHDDCSSEFRRLRNAQYDFESAVSSLGGCY